MRKVSAILCLLACSTPVWAGLAHIPVVTNEAQSFVGFSRIVPIDCVVPEIAATSVAAPMAPQAAESVQFVGMAKAAPIESDVAGMRGMVGYTSDVAALALPRFSGIGGVTVQEVDPFLTWYDIWSEGALGELRSAAIDAAKRGDDAAYRRLVERYWAGVALASERRQLHAAKPADGTKGVRAVRRNSR